MFNFIKKFFAVPSAEEIKKETEAKVQPIAPIQPIINQPQTQPKKEPAKKPAVKKETAPKQKAPAKITGTKKAPAKPKKK